jgi:hypothetical protein
MFSPDLSTESYPVYALQFLPRAPCVRAFIISPDSASEIVDARISTRRVTALPTELVLTKDDGVNDVSSGNVYTFVINVTNTARNIALDVTVRDDWPFSAYVILNTSSVCFARGVQVFCSWDQIHAGASVQATISYAVRSSVAAGTLVTNCACLESTASVPGEPIKVCETNRIVAAACLPYNSVCSSTNECCSPLTCLRHADGCHNLTKTNAFRCGSRGGSSLEGG